MEVFILNTNFESIAVVDSFKSLIWTERYDEAGDFELTMLMDESYLDFIRQDNYVWNAESSSVMIIDEISITSDTESGNLLIVSGYSLEKILDRRIVWGQTVLQGDFQEGVKTLLDENAINPSDSARKIPNLIFEESSDTRILGLTIDAQYTGDNLYDVISTLCKKNNIGFRITLDDSNRFVFALYAGTDRSYDQTENPYVVFSPNFENIINSSYLESKKNYKNVTLVAGEGEGASRKTSIVGSASGLERRELYTDARDVSSDVGDGETLTEEQYKEQLDHKGTDALAENAAVTAFEGEVEATRMFVFGRDFFIGDIVQVANEYGHEGTAYISEFMRSQEEGGISTYPTFKMTDGGDEYE